MAPKLSGQNCKFLLSSNSQKRLRYRENNTKYRSLTRKPGSHVRILIYRTWPIGLHCLGGPSNSKLMHRNSTPDIFYFLKEVCNMIPLFPHKTQEEVRTCILLLLEINERNLEKKKKKWRGMKFFNIQDTNFHFIDKKELFSNYLS